MILVTRRVGLQAQLQANLARVWGRGKTRSVHEFLSSRALVEAEIYLASRKQYLLVDLESCLGESDALSNIGGWCESHPWVFPVFLVNVSRLAQQLALVDALKEKSPTAMLVEHSQIVQRQTWDLIYERHLANRVGADIEHALWVRGELVGGIPAQQVVLAAVRIVPRVRSAQALCRLLQRNRTTLYAELRDAGQVTAKELINLIRILYVAKLRSMKWSYTAIARYMGYGSRKEFCRILDRNGPYEDDEAGYERALCSVVSQLTGSMKSRSAAGTPPRQNRMKNASAI